MQVLSYVLVQAARKLSAFESMTVGRANDLTVQRMVRVSIVNRMGIAVIAVEVQIEAPLDRRCGTTKIGHQVVRFVVLGLLSNPYESLDRGGEFVDRLGHILR